MTPEQQQARLTELLQTQLGNLVMSLAQKTVELEAAQARIAALTTERDALRAEQDKKATKALKAV